MLTKNFFEKARQRRLGALKRLPSCINNKVPKDGKTKRTLEELLHEREVLKQLTKSDERERRSKKDHSRMAKIRI